MNSGLKIPSSRLVLGSGSSDSDATVSDWIILSQLSNINIESLKSLFLMLTWLRNLVRLIKLDVYVSVPKILVN